MKITEYLIIALGLCLLNLSTQAANFCVGSSAELYEALQIADSNGESDTINILRGTYVVPATGFRYIGDNEDHDLTIRGGWSSSPGFPCSLWSRSPFNTIIDGLEIRRGMELVIGEQTNLLVTNLYFRNGFVRDDHPRPEGGGLRVSTHDHNGSDSNSEMTIERNVFINNEARSGAAFYIGNKGNINLVRNNLIALNTSSSSGAAVFILQHYGIGSFFVNNTVVNNDHLLGNSSAGVNIGNDTVTLIANNVIWGNHAVDQYADLQMSIHAAKYLYNNDIGTIIDGGGYTAFENNISADPEFGVGYAPSDTSPLVNSGRPPGINDLWSYGDDDLFGDPREQGGRVDMGAIELYIPDIIFRNDFEQLLK